MRCLLLGWSCLHVDDAIQDYDIAGDEDSQHLYLLAGTFQQFFDILSPLTIQKGMSVSTGL